MKQTRWLVWASLASFFVISATPSSDARERIEPGYYEVTTTIEESNIDVDKTPTVTHVCLTKERLNDLNGDEQAYRRDIMRGAPGCLVEDLALVDRMASYTVRCGSGDANLVMGLLRPTTVTRVRRS